MAFGWNFKMFRVPDDFWSRKSGFRSINTNNHNNNNKYKYKYEGLWLILYKMISEVRVREMFCSILVIRLKCLSVHKRCWYSGMKYLTKTNKQYKWGIYWSHGSFLYWHPLLNAQCQKYIYIYWHPLLNY